MAANIAKRPNGRWRARYRDDTGREHARHFVRKVDAQAWLDEQTARMVRGEWADPRAGRELLSAYATRWQSVQVSSPGTARIVDNALRLHILPRLGSERVANIRRSDVQAFVKWLESRELRPATESQPARTLSAGSVRNIYEVLARVMDAAVEDRVIAVSPCRRIALPKGHDDEVEVPTLDEIDRVRDALAERWQVLPVVLAGSGLRVGELLGLRLSDVDFLRRSIRVERQRLQTNQIAPLKSKASRRRVPVGQVVIDALAAHLASYPPTEEALFTDEFGKPLTYRRWKRLVSDAAKVAGAEITSHSFRHFAASALISGGASVKQVQAFLGHASAVVTLRTYAHLWPGDEDRTRKVLDAALGPLGARADSVRTEVAPEG
ncbi:MULTISPECIES: site-specific integrase [unclassified Nocardioides]|uniref:tyrosine-type recombinase/integrase n=1 Tax=unclassified Nocardioides TaxID=2615069 RepID=UPI000057078E|nr:MULTISPECIES: site-specific integrase [unclassified Nocardioides]ABL81237.1 phage integrase family protein [Nocardioides sp. JS614]